MIIYKQIFVLGIFAEIPFKTSHVGAWLVFYFITHILPINGQMKLP